MGQRQHGCIGRLTISFSHAHTRPERVFLGRMVSSTASEVRDGAWTVCAYGSGLGVGRVGGVMRRTMSRHGAADGPDGHKLRCEAYSGKEIMNL